MEKIDFIEPTAAERKSAQMAHNLFLSNLIGNHILIFTGISAFGPRYFYFMVLVPLISFSTLAYTFYRASKVKREDSQFIYIHWQIAKRWSILFGYVLSLLVSVSLLGWLGHTYLGLMKEAVYGMIGGLGLLPTMVSVFVLLIIESDSLNHARSGTLPKWARQRYLGEVDLDEGIKE